MIKFEDLKGCLKQKIGTVYLLSGIDEYLLSSAYKMIVKASELEVEDLNLIKFAEGVIDCNDIVRACETMPVFSNKKIVYLDLRLAKKTELKNVKLLNDYINNANPTTVLIINTGANDDDFGLDKKALELVDCNRLDIKFVEAKVNSVLRAKQKSISQSALKMLIEYCLGDMAKIMVETDKLVSFIGGRVEIQNSDIEEIVTRSIEYRKGGSLGECAEYHACCADGLAGGRCHARKADCAQALALAWPHRLRNADLRHERIRKLLHAGE